MFLDLERDDGLKHLSADICIVGAGPAGITLATELMSLGLTICLAESGGLRDEGRTQRLYEGTSIGHPVWLTEGRHRIFGGSATRWGGRSAMMDPIDFETRGWIPNASWPIALDDVRRYYDRARKALNFDGPWLDDESTLALAGRTLPHFESTDITPYVWRFAPPERKGWVSRRLGLGPRRSYDWGAASRATLRQARDVSVVLHANLVDLDPAAEDGAIRTARFKALNGRSLEVGARLFVVCCSGIENARILLNLNTKLAGGLPGGDNIGRYFSQHPRGTILTLETGRAQSLRLQHDFNEFSGNGADAAHYQLGFALSEQAQRRHGLLNASAGMHYSSSSWSAGRRLRNAVKGRYYIYPGALRDVGRLILGIFPMLAVTWTKQVAGRQPLFPGGTISVVADLEQEPQSESRVTLSAERDPLGVPRTVVDWRISETERTTARKFAEAIAGELGRLGYGAARLAPWLTSGEPVREEHLASNYHLIGTTRMAATPETGVVDENARVFGVSNLYMAGSSVFATGGHANPTLTIIALTLRLADHLKSRLAALDGAGSEAPDRTAAFRLQRSGVPE